MLCKIETFNYGESIEGQEVSHIRMWLCDNEYDDELLIATKDEIYRILADCPAVNAPE